MLPKQFSLATEVEIIGRETDCDMEQRPEFLSVSRCVALLQCCGDYPELFVPGCILESLPVEVLKIVFVLEIIVNAG